MPTCKMCSSKCSLWQTIPDGLCPNCREKEVDRMKQKECEDAKIRIKQFASQIVPVDEIDIFGIAIWDTSGSKLSSIYHLWVGRFLLGMLGDILHSNTRILGIVILSRIGILYAAKIGEIAKGGLVSPALIRNSTLGTKSMIKTTKRRDIGIDTDNNLVVTLPNGKKLCATFPSCFIEDNVSVPSRIISILNNQQLNKTKKHIPSKTDRSNVAKASISACSSSIEFHHCPYCNADMLPMSDGRCANCKEFLP